MLETQKFLQTGTIDDISKSFGIHTKVYDDRIVFNYRIDSKPKFHPIVLECRGLILSLPDYKVLCRSFDRFFNYGEGDDKDSFNWNNCIVFNKLDGSLINVYHDGNKWCAATRGTAFAEGKTPMDKTYYNLFLDAIGTDLEHGFEFCSKHHTYIFEITSPENRIVTRYYETTTTLLAIRNNLTGLYVDYDCINTKTDFNMQTDGLAPSYNLNNPKDIIKFVEGRDAMDEGVVCFDKYTQKRIKIKNASYVAIHRLKGEGENSVKGFVELAFKQEEEEFLCYFSEYTDIMNKYTNAYNKFIDSINNLWNKTKHIKDQKEFAMIVKDTPISGILFSLKKGNNIVDIIENLSIDKKVNLLFNFIK